MLFYADNLPFATGMTPYIYRSAKRQGEDLRIFLQVTIAGISTTAVLDTGSSYAIVAPSIAQLLDLDPTDSVEQPSIRIRGISYKGNLYRLELSIQSVKGGEGLKSEVTAFIPITDETGWGDLPCFLGMANCLDRLRFAIDPSKDVFYFGPLE